MNGERYAIPQRELEEAVCLHPGMPGRIEQAFDTEVYRLRDRLLPIVRLRDVLSRPEPFTAATKAEILAAHAANDDPARIEYILVLRLPGRRFGLVVDEVRGTEEIVVKPMHTSIKRVGIFTGATIMGDGRVALIADVAGYRRACAAELRLGAGVGDEGRGRAKRPRRIASCCSNMGRTSNSLCPCCRSVASR